MAKKAFEDGFYEVSMGLLERFLKNYPDSPKVNEANLLIGECYFHQNRFLEALNKFDGLINQSSSKSIKDALLYWIAEVHFKGNSFDKAATYYKRVVDEFPNSVYSPAALYSLGWCLFQEQKFDEALKIFMSVEKNYPKEPQGRDSSFKIVECLYNLKDYSVIKEKAKNYLKVFSKDPSHLSYVYFYLAESDYYLNNFTDAIEEYAKVISTTEDEKMQSLSKLGQAWSYLKLKRYKEAQSVFFEIKEPALDKKALDVFLLGKAFLMVETNKVNEAKRIYDRLTTTSSDPLVLMQAYLGKADALYNLANYEEAVNVYKEALEKSGRDGLPGELVDKLHYSLAWAYLKQGEFKEAIKEFQRIVKTSDDNTVKVSALCQIGDTYQDSGDYLKAQETYDIILKDYPDSFYSDYVQYQLGLTLLKSLNYEGAIMSFLALKRNYPDSKLLDDAYYALGLAYFQKQDYNAGKEIFSKFQEEFKESTLKPQALYLLGTSFYNLGLFKEAIDVFKNVAREYSQDTELVQKAEYEIADCYSQMGNEKEAMNRFKMLRSKYPDSSLTPEVMWWLGEYYYRHNELGLTRRYFSSLIKDFPGSNLIADAYYALGSSFEEESRYEEAVDNFNKVLALGRSDLAGQATIAIADIYVKQKKPDLALIEYKNCLPQYPNLSSLIYPKMADLFFKRGDYVEALDYYRKALDISSIKDMAVIHIKTAEVLQAQGKPNEAIEEYMKVTYLFPENNAQAVKAYLRVAQIYEEKEDFKEALNIYKKAISINTEEAKYAQERIDWINSHAR